MAALPITLILSLALLVAVGYANRSTLMDVRSANNQLRAAQAQEAAQAGLAWTITQLNQTQATGEDCQPIASTTALAWHDRALRGPLQASCTWRDERWQCHCPAAGEARLVGGTGAPSFSVLLTPDAHQPDRWHLVSTGHGDAAGTRAQLQLDIGRLPALDSLPAAALTVRGNAHLGGAFGLHHVDPASGGVTLHTGGAVDASELTLHTTPGTPPSVSVVSNDGPLMALTPDGLHASLFRLSRSAWSDQPAVGVVDCHATCNAQLATAAARHPLLMLSGGLKLDAPLTLGSAERPVLLVVDGPIELNAVLTLHGVIYARHATWGDSAGSTVIGAVVVEGDLDAHGATQVHHDLAVLQALQRRGGTYAPLHRSWRDL